MTPGAFLNKDSRLKTISSIASQTTITAEQATLFADLAHQLPAGVNCTLSDSSVVLLPVVWAIGSYNKDVPATYTLSGTITLPSNITNPSVLTASIGVTVQWSPLADQSKNILWLNPSNKNTLLQESASNTPITAVNIVGDKIGWLMDRSLGARDITASVDTRRPQYYIDTDGYPLMEFNGTSTQLVVQNSTKYLNTLHSASPVWSAVIYVKRKVNGSNTVIFASDSGASANSGIYLGITASDTLTLIVTKAGTTMVNVTTTDTLKVANGRQPIFIELNGAGTNTGRIAIGAGTFKTFNITAGGSGDAFANLTVGSRNDNQFFNNDYIGDFVIRNGTLSAGDITNYQAYLPQDKGFWFAPVLQNQYDYTDSTNNFSDAGATTQVTNNDQILYTKNKATLPTGAGTSNTDATGTNGNAPIWKTNQQNGLAAAAFDGTGLKQTLQTATNKGGIYTAIVVYRNDNTTVGSTMLNGHIAVAENQTTDAEFGACFRAVNGSGSLILESNCPNKNNVTNLSILERLPNTINIYNGYKDVKTLTGDTDTLSYSTIGNGVNSTIHMNGIITEILIYKGKFANINSVIDTYNSKYAITPTSASTPSVLDIPFYIHFGQSNIESAAPFQNTGHNAYSTMPGYLQATQSLINLYNGSGFSANFTHNSSCTWGWTDELWYRESIRLNKPIFALKFGRPSTTLGTANPFPQATALSYLSDAYAKLCATYGRTRIHPIVFWDQGISDAANSTDASNYQTNLTNWFASLRQILGNDTVIVYLRLANWSTQTFTTTVQAAQDALSNSQNIEYNTDAIAHTADNQHYSEVGCPVLGQALSTLVSSYIR